MSEHINGWLAAYFDGQLGERRTQKVEAHLEGCEECRRELERLSSLRLLLQNKPEAKETISTDRFVAQVGLRLQPRSARSTMRRALSAMWIMVPVGLLGIWVFIQTLTTLTGLTGFAFDAGLWRDFAKYFSPASQSNILSPLSWRIVLSSVTGLISLSWLASWWITQTRNQVQRRTE